MPVIVTEVLALLGFIIRLIGFLVFGLAVGRFVWDNFKTSEWQVKVALALGFFALAAALTHYASPGSSGAFALGGGVAFLMAGMPKKDKEEAK
jgi:hypothetical protein